VVALAKPELRATGLPHPAVPLDNVPLTPLLRAWRATCGGSPMNTNTMNTPLCEAPLAGELRQRSRRFAIP